LSDKRVLSDVIGTEFLYLEKVGPEGWCIKLPDPSWVVFMARLELLPIIWGLRPIAFLIGVINDPPIFLAEFMSPSLSS
jgi:hypothetical protein